MIDTVPIQTESNLFLEENIRRILSFTRPLSFIQFICFGFLFLFIGFLSLLGGGIAYLSISVVALMGAVISLKFLSSSVEKCIQRSISVLVFNFIFLFLFIASAIGDIWADKEIELNFLIVLFFTLFVNQLLIVFLLHKKTASVFLSRVPRSALPLLSLLLIFFTFVASAIVLPSLFEEIRVGSNHTIKPPEPGNLKVYDPSIGEFR